MAPNRRDGRWNIAPRDIVQYLCLDAEAPFAEMLRGEDLDTEQYAGTFFTTLWQLRIDEGAIVDYSTLERVEAAGMSAEALLEDDHERCQAEASWLRSQGAGGVLAPCAALDGAVNLTLFGPRVHVGWDADAPLASMVPAQAIITGSAPVGLVPRTRYYGKSHPLLARHRRAQGTLFGD